MNNSILLSVVVPTKNRYKYLKKLVELFCQLATEDMELVIQDNSDDPSDFKLFIDNIKDRRICYYYDSINLSVVDNCDRAIARSHGEFVSMIDFIEILLNVHVI